MARTPTSKRLHALECAAERTARGLVQDPDIKIVVGGMAHYSPSDRTLTVPSYMDEPEDVELVNSWRGLLDHECAHAVLTDHDVTTDAMRAWTAEFGGATANRLFYMANGLEDARIERVWAESYPGSRWHFEAKGRYYLRELGHAAMSDPAYRMKNGTVLGMWGALVFSCRVLAGGLLEPTDLHPTSRQLLALVQAEYEAGRDAETTADVLAATEALWRKLQEAKPEQPEQEDGDDEDDEGDDEEEEENVNDIWQDEQEDERDEEDEDEDDQDGGGSGDDDTGDGSDGPDDSPDTPGDCAASGSESDSGDPGEGEDDDRGGDPDEEDEDDEGDEGADDGDDEGDGSDVPGDEEGEEDDEDEDGDDGDDEQGDGDDLGESEPDPTDDGGADADGDADADADGDDAAAEEDEGGDPAAGDVGADLTDEDGDHGAEGGDEPGGGDQFTYPPEMEEPVANAIGGAWAALPTEQEIVGQAFVGQAPIPPYTVFPPSAARDMVVRYDAARREAGRKLLPPLVQAAGTATQKLVNLMRSAIQASRQTLRIGGVEDGDWLDEDQIGMISSGLNGPDVFVQEVRRVEESTGVMVLVDCSGSMGRSAPMYKCPADHGKPQSLAGYCATCGRDLKPVIATEAGYAAVTAMALHKALRACRVAHAVSGYTTHPGVRVLREKRAEAPDFCKWSRASAALEMHLFVEAPGLADDGSALPYITGRRTNLDGESVLWAARYAAANFGHLDRVILIVVADGLPSGCDDRNMNSPYLTQTVERIASAGIEVYGVGVGVDPERFAGYYPDAEAGPQRAPTGNVIIDPGGAGLDDAVLRGLTALLTRGYGASRKVKL